MKRSFILLVTVMSSTSLYASFPVLENLDAFHPPIFEADIKITAKILWFLSGMIFYGIPISIIYQLISQKRGPIKYALFGALAIILFFTILILLIESGIEDPFVFS
jgi:hypothetical protein